jgi:hypothetical protein
MMEDWNLVKSFFKSNKKEIWKELKFNSPTINSLDQKNSTGARFFLEKVLIHSDPLTLFCSARIVIGFFSLLKIIFSNIKIFKKKKKKIGVQNMESIS